MHYRLYFESTSTCKVSLRNKLSIFVSSRLTALGGDNGVSSERIPNTHTQIKVENKRRGMMSKQLARTLR